MKMYIPGVLRAISQDVDEASYTIHYNMLICMVTSIMLFLGAIASFTVRFFFFDWPLWEAALDSAALAALGAGFEIFMRTKVKSLPCAAHIISILYSGIFIFIMLRFYSVIGPSLWVLGIVQMLFSMASSSPVMLRYTIGAISLAIANDVLFADVREYGLFYNVMLITFFVLSAVVSLILYKVINTRNQKIKMQYERILLERKQRRKTREENVKLSFYDALTGLPNMVLMNEKIRQALFFAQGASEKVYILIINMDMFKSINHATGSMAGDEILKLVGQRLSAVSDYCFVARADGDEFAVLMQCAADAEVRCIAERILQSVNEVMVIGGNRFSLTCSIGISRYPSDGKDAETLIKSAELAKDNAKKDGKNCYVFFSAEMKRQLQTEMEILHDMRDALHNGEFELYYQPQVSNSEKKIIGIEALIRWNHPKRGFLLPGDFISVAEKSGLIVPVGEWVLKTACTQNKAWQDEGFATVPVAVNISPKQIYDEDIVEKLSRILEETKLKPQFLELEITERALISNIEKAKDILRRIRQLGVQIAIDDFGTGYSSIYYLKQLPIDTIKVPMEFVHGISNSVKDESIISVILELAENLNLKVIAEGVETKQQLDFLTKNNCDSIQGYFFCRPMAAQIVRPHCEYECARHQKEREAVGNA